MLLLGAAEAQLLLELLKHLEFQKVDKVVLPAVPIADVGTVSLAAELGFLIKANSADSLLMVRDGDLPLPQNDVVVVTRKLRKDLSFFSFFFQVFLWIFCAAAAVSFLRYFACRWECRKLQG